MRQPTSFVIIMNVFQINKKKYFFVPNVIKRRNLIMELRQPSQRNFDEVKSWGLFRGTDR